MLSVWVADSSHTKPALSLGPISSSFASRTAKPLASWCYFYLLGKCQCCCSMEYLQVGSWWRRRQHGENTSVVPDAFPMHLLPQVPNQLPLCSLELQWSSTTPSVAHGFLGASCPHRDTNWSKERGFRLLLIMSLDLELTDTRAFLVYVDQAKRWTFSSFLPSFSLTIVHSPLKSYNLVASFAFRFASHLFLQDIWVSGSICLMFVLFTLNFQMDISNGCKMLLWLENQTSPGCAWLNRC